MRSARQFRARSGREQMQQHCVLFDHLVGAGEHGRRHIEVERLGGDQIDDEIEFGGLFDREVGRLRAAKTLST